jgi:excisionase family DNA binding protein
MTAQIDQALLTGRQVSQVLNISRSRAYRWMATGILPTVRIESRRFVRVPKDGLMRWIEQNTHVPKTPEVI